MNRPLDSLLDTDLDAYVDDQLDVPRRIEVEAYLSAHPTVAARVMSDLRTRDELRLALAWPKGMARPATSDAARRLERGLARGRIWSNLRRGAAIFLLVAAGWGAHGLFGSHAGMKGVALAAPPPYVKDAIEAQKASVVRAAMVSQPEVPDFDPAEIRAATSIVLPALPDNWKVKDVQVFPSQFGASVEMTVDSKDAGELSLFAVRPGTFEVVSPTVVTTTDATSAYFQVGEVAYALVAKPGTEHLDRIAAGLASSLY